MRPNEEQAIEVTRIAFSPPRPASETADLVDLLQAKARSQPEA